ncbi:MAG: hypothetical protein ACRYG7_08730 [Janthinobacterium lividum]
MSPFYYCGIAARRSLLPSLLLFALAARVHAQAPTWTLATSGVASTAAYLGCNTRATAADAHGNIFITGNFSGQITFGTTTLTSLGFEDIFVAKYVPATNTWAWAVRGGGTNSDTGTGLAVSGNSVYVTGLLSNNTANASRVLLGGTGATANTVRVNGASAIASGDILLAKYVDNGSSASLAWTQVAGGTNGDYSTALAVSGTSIYLAGSISNSLTNSSGVVFGGDGTTLGTLPQYGASTSDNTDLVLAKYVDNGPSASVAWTQVGGGTDSDYGYGVAVSGSSVYVTGSLSNTSADARAVLFGGTGPTPGTVRVRGAANAFTTDLVLVKYVDNGPSASLGWVQVGGGTGDDYGSGVAVSGSNVYVAGQLTNNLTNTNRVLLGDNGTSAGTVAVNGASATTSADILVAKYVDNGPSASVAWTQIAGGTGADYASSLALRGSTLVLAGSLTNTIANANNVVVGGDGTTPGTVAVSGATTTSSSDLLVARYTDNGPSASFVWAQVGGSTGTDRSAGLALTGSGVFVGGSVGSPATFGTLTVNGVAGVSTAFLGGFGSTALPTRTASAGSAGWVLYPNPAGSSGAATLSGLVPGTAVQVLDALGRQVGAATADASGTAPLPAGLLGGVYVLRAGTQTLRLAVE